MVNKAKSFDFGETVDYNTADEILTGAGILMEGDGYSYNRNKDSSETQHIVADQRSQGGTKEYVSIGSELDNNHRGRKIEIKADIAAQSGKPITNIDSELSKFEEKLEEECDRVLG
jgi:hypothetical protein